MLLRLAFAAGLLFSIGLVPAGTASAQTLPALYAEAGGATGLYAVGLEQLVLRSGDDARRLSVRVGVSYRTETAYQRGYSEEVLSVPMAVEASFSLGRPLGLATRFEVGAGAVISRRDSEYRRLLTGNERVLVPDTYSQAVISVEPSRRLAIRAGLTSSGDRSSLVGTAARPVLGVSARL